MPRNLPHWTTCAAPGTATPHDTGLYASLVISLVQGFFAGLAGTLILLEIIGVALKISMTLGCAFAAAFIVAIIFALQSFMDWYDHRRLLCIQHDQCAIGVVVQHPSIYTDGDTAFNIALAPFSQSEHYAGLKSVIAQKRAAGAPYPDPATLGSFAAMIGFLKSLKRDPLINIYQTHVWQQLLAPAAATNRDFQRRFFVKTPDVDAVTPGTAAAMDDDSFVPDGATNPMFRCPWDEGDGTEPEDKRNGFDLVEPYMHCEVEGHRLIAILENIRNALIAGGIAYIAMCIACEVLTAGAGTVGFCGWVSGAIAALVAFLAWLFGQYVANKPGDKSASSLDPNVQDPDFGLDPLKAEKGDVVALFGDWIMDEEHGQYFELHPVKAYHYLGKDGSLRDTVRDRSDVFDASILVKSDFERICRLITDAETKDPPMAKTASSGFGLSTLGGLR
jgi:hypothetical protein